MTDLACPACGLETPEWAAGPGGRPNARCPNCQSLERHRFLSLVLRAVAASAPRSVRTVLDCAPHQQVRRVLVDAFPTAMHVGMDLLEPDRDINLLADLTAAPLRAGSVDLIVCYHVLEHIPDDRAAMSELARVLAPDGLAILQVPYRPTAATDEDPSASEEERIRRFGQADHVRWYGKDFDTRLQESGLPCQRRNPDQLVDDAAMTRYGISPVEPVWFGSAADDTWSLRAQAAVATTTISPIETTPPVSARGGLLSRLRRD